MIPIMIDPGRLRITVIGNGRATLRRLSLLRDGGAADIAVFAPRPAEGLKDAVPNLLQRLPTRDDLTGADVVWIADLDAEQSDELAGMAKDAGALVNAEDITELCDFHNVAAVRRGDLVVTASTGGKCPRLARRLRTYLADLFPPAWADRVDRLEARRQELKEAGAAFSEVAKELDRMIDENGWLR